MTDVMTFFSYREELKEQHVAMEKQEGRIRELKRLQETSKIKIQVMSWEDAEADAIKCCI